MEKINDFKRKVDEFGKGIEDTVKLLRNDYDTYKRSQEQMFEKLEDTTKKIRSSHTTLASEVSELGVLGA